MFPRWLWFNHVPAGLHLTKEQYLEVRRRVREMGPGQRRFTPMSKRMLVYLIPRLILASLIFAAWTPWWLVSVRPSGRSFVLLNLAGIALFQVLLWVLIARSINLSIRPLVWRALNMIDVPVCESCGYILQHLPREATPNCPECGAKRDTTGVSTDSSNP